MNDQKTVTIKLKVLARNQKHNAQVVAFALMQ